MSHFAKVIDGIVTEVLVIETTPAGADVELSTGARCKSPCSMEMKRKNAVVVDITKDGYEPVRVNVLSQVAGAGAGGDDDAHALPGGQRAADDVRAFGGGGGAHGG